MATITLTAVPGHLEEEAGRGYAMKVVELGCTMFGRVQAEAKTLDEVRARVKSFGSGVAAQHPERSFIVLVGVAKGSRKPSGFDAANRRDGLGQEAWMRTIAPESGHPAIAA